MDSHGTLRHEIYREHMKHLLYLDVQIDFLIMFKEGLGEIVEHIRLHEVECKLVKLKPGEITSVIDEVQGIISQFPAVKVFPLLLRVSFSPVKRSEKNIKSTDDQVIGSVDAQVLAWKDLLEDICDEDC